MRHIIYGAGAIGGTIGARLHLAGQNVLLIARGEHLEKLQKDGMNFLSPDGQQNIRLPVVSHPSEIEFESGDVVFLTMKSQHSMEAMDSLYQAAGPDIPVICCQNGVANERMAARQFAKPYAMVVLLPASHINPGEIVHHASSQKENHKGGILDAGVYPEGTDDLIASVARHLEEAGFSCQLDDHIMRWKYAKLLQNLGNSLQAIAGLESDAKDLMSQMIREALNCYKAAHIDCASREEVAAKRKGTLQMESVEGFKRGGGSSWQSLQRGTGSIEANYLNGEICLLGKLHGVPTPANEVMRRLSIEVASKELAPGAYTVDQIREMIKKRTRFRN